MANIAIYDGNANFVAGESTPFGFYDDDLEFQKDAPKVAEYCAKKLGFPMMDVELSSGSFFAAFEEAVTSYGNEVFQAIAAQQFTNLQGQSGAVAINSLLVKPSLENTIRTSQQYGMEAGVGGFTTKYTGSIAVNKDQQNYDLNQWALDQGISGGIEIRKVFYEAPPAIQRFFDPYAGTGTGIQSLMDAFDFGSFSPGINFMLMPISYDIAKIQAIELNDQVRKSAYSFEIVNNQLKLFPIPKDTGSLYFEYFRREDKQFVDDSLNVSAMAVAGSEVDGSGNASTSNGIITNLSNVPTENPIYAEINSTGRQWIFKYTATICKEMLAYVRGKYQTVPVPGSEATLNQADLLSDVRSEKESYIVELRELLNQASLNTQLELQAQQTQYLGDALKGVPMGIYIG
jgi:hypothetical protein